MKQNVHSRGVALYRLVRAFHRFSGMWLRRMDSKHITPEYRHQPQRITLRTAWKWAWHDRPNAEGQGRPAPDSPTKSNGSSAGRSL